MKNVNFIVIEGREMAIVDHGNDEFTSMTKAHYEELEAQREQSGTL